MIFVMKKGQIFSTEVYIAIVLFLVALVVFYAIISQKSIESNVDQEAERIAASIMMHPFFQDGVLTSGELDDIALWNCTYLKDTFDTSNSMCVYVKNEDGSMKLLDGTSMFIGCDDVQMGGVNCTNP
jgi:hypothetical protein